MTVSDLIKELKKWPNDMLVVTAAFDNGDDEYQGEVKSLHELNPGLMRDDLGERAVVLRG